MTASEFVGRLKMADRNIRVYHGPEISGIYLKMARHPDANPKTGLKHLCGMPSPRVLWNIPMWSLKINGKRHPGVCNIVQKIANKKMAGHGPLVNRGRLRSLFPKAFDKRYIHAVEA